MLFGLVCECVKQKKNIKTFFRLVFAVSNAMRMHFFRRPHGCNFWFAMKDVPMVMVAALLFFTLFYSFLSFRRHAAARRIRNIQCRLSDYENRYAVDG